MMKTLKEKLNQHEKLPVYIIAILALGVFLLAMSGPLQRTADSEPPPPAPETATITKQPSTGKERALEKRLEEALSLVEGVGRVRVLVNFSQGSEKTFATDTTTSSNTTQEQDAQGGTRYQSSQQAQSTTLFTADRQPLVITETPPQIGGVVIIAEGGDNIMVRDALIRAAGTLLGVDINRVHVMKMKNER